MYDAISPCHRHRRYEVGLISILAYPSSPDLHVTQIKARLQRPHSSILILRLETHHLPRQLIRHSHLRDSELHIHMDLKTLQALELEVDLGIAIMPGFALDES